MSFRRITTLVTAWAFCFMCGITQTKAQGFYEMNIAKMYSLASQGNVQALRYASQNGFDLDTTDKYGNTGLCHSIYQRNYTAYNALISAGSNANHPCMKRIPPENYEAFASNNPNTTTTYRNSSPEPQKTVYRTQREGYFPTPNNFWWYAGGVAAVGVVVGLLSHSGEGTGGGSGDNPGGNPDDPDNPDNPDPADDGSIPGNGENGDGLGQYIGTKIPTQRDPASGFPSNSNMTTLSNGSTVVLEDALVLQNESQIEVMGAFTNLTELINLHDSVNIYSEYIGVVAKAINGGYVSNGDEFGVSASSITIGDATAGMVAYGSTSAVRNYNNITVNSQNASIAMIASKYKTYDSLVVETLASNEVTGTINLNMDGAVVDDARNKIIGMYADSGATAKNEGTITGVTKIDGSLVGMEAKVYGVNAPEGKTTLENSGTIDLTMDANNRTSLAFVVGMTAYNGNALSYSDYLNDISNTGLINIKATYTGGGTYIGDVRTGKQGIVGMLSDYGSSSKNESGQIIIDATNVSQGAAGMLSINGGVSINEGDITINNGTYNYGMLAVTSSLSLETSMINYSNINMNSANGYGMASYTGGNIDNYGNIRLSNGGIGMYMSGPGVAINGLDTENFYTGYIEVNDSTGSATTYGMFADNGGTVINEAMIRIITGGSNASIGMGADGVGSQAINLGTIEINGNSTIPTCVAGSGCGNHIKVTNGAMFSNNGSVLMRAPLNFNSFADDISFVEVNKGGTYEAPTLEGKVYAGSDIVASGFEKVYVNEDSFVGEDKGIDLVSNSALFDAELRDNGSGGHDVVMTMKQFDSVVTDAQIAQYLQSNYDLGNGAILMSSLKSAKDLGVLNGMVIQSLGLDTIPNFAKQNIDVLKSLNAKMHESLFAQELKDERIIIGYDHYYRDQDGLGVFTGYEDKANSVYALGDKKYDDNFRYGLGISLTQYESDYDNNNERKEAIVQIFAPLTFMLNEDLKLLSIPRIGYGFGDYQRKANGIKYGADTENYYYGITNELRKSFDMGMFILEPTLEFNVLGLYQDDTKENHQGLEVKSSNNLSIEGGLGLYAAKEFELTEVDTLRLRLGGTYYYELNNPYQAAEAKMSGMAGSYHMESYEAQRNRGVLSLRADYQRNMLNFYIQLNQYFEDKNAFSFNAGIGYMF